LSRKKSPLKQAKALKLTQKVRRKPQQQRKKNRRATQTDILAGDKTRTRAHNQYPPDGKTSGVFFA
jgi:hypothetical protein